MNDIQLLEIVISAIDYAKRRINNGGLTIEDIKGYHIVLALLFSIKHGIVKMMNKE